MGERACDWCRAGTLNVAACEELGVRPGRDYSRVKAGESVLSRSGEIIRPEQVSRCLLMPSFPRHHQHAADEDQVAHM